MKRKNQQSLITHLLAQLWLILISNWVPISITRAPSIAKHVLRSWIPRSHSVPNVAPGPTTSQAGLLTTHMSIRSLSHASIVHACSSPMLPIAQDVAEQHHKPKMLVPPASNARCYCPRRLQPVPIAIVQWVCLPNVSIVMRFCPLARTSATHVALAPHMRWMPMDNSAMSMTNVDSAWSMQMPLVQTQPSLHLPGNPAHLWGRPLGHPKPKTFLSQTAAT